MPSTRRHLIIIKMKILFPGILNAISNVFCGLSAEYQLEHMVEKEGAGQ